MRRSGRWPQPRSGRSESAAAARSAVARATPSCRIYSIGRPVTASAADVGQHEVERSRHLGVVERLDEEARVADLPAAAAAHEAPELVLGGPALPLRLLLQGSERAKVSVLLDD